ncbi:PAS domain-containing protein [Halostella salina]|uniref:PAS domain-containing protein n=1 Tax=Halostella salina TaxID=1547897 RepID=UPI000EF7DC09|nr:PAS domain-containing protein [Halostella salina]
MTRSRGTDSAERPQQPILDDTAADDGPAPDGVAVGVVGPVADGVATALEQQGFDVVAYGTPPTDAAVDCLVAAHDPPAVDAPELAADSGPGGTPVLLYDRVPPPTVEQFVRAGGTHVSPDADDGERRVLAATVLRTVGRARERSHLELQRRAIDQAPVGITIATADGDQPLVYANDGFEAMTGYRVEEVVGRNCRFLQGPETDESTVAKLRTAIDRGERVAVDLLNYRRDGTPFWNQLDIAPVRDANGTVTHFFGFQKEITERKELEEELRRRNERLDRFADIVSHDLRNPLNAAVGNLDLARETGDEGHLDDAEAALDRMDALIASMLTVAREGTAVEEPEPVDLGEVAERAWEVAGPADGELVVETGVGSVEGDPDRVRSLFENLFRNVADHGGEKPVVRVESTRTGFAVEDDGPGIPPEDRKAVFEWGVSDGGTGIGLAIVDAVAEAHGWSVSVEGGRAGGARFSFDTGPNPGGP